MSKDQKQYSELQGGVGRAVHFRTERFRSRALLGELSPELWVGDARARLYDVSMNGLSFYVPPSEAPGDGLEVPIRLLLDGEEGFRGSARVVRTDVEGGLVKIGATIVSGFIDIPRLVSLHDNAAFERSVSAGSRRYSSVPADYSASVHAASVFLAHWSRLLDERERRLVDDGASPEAVLRLELRLEEQMRREWREVRARANETSRVCYEDAATLLAAKRLTELLVTPQLRVAPLWWDAYTKPLGYPGDFRMMTYMYESDRRGDTMFGRIMHQLGREERLAWTVTSRKELMLEQLARAIRATQGEGPVRIASLASGPAREIQEFLERYDGSRRLEFTLIDQDDRALSYAYERLIRASARLGDRVRVTCLFTSFRQLIGNPELLEQLGNHDFIYSAGFFDYLDAATASRVAENCMKLVRPGGRGLFGNAAVSDDVHWVPEFVLDWRLTLRTRDELVAAMPTKGISSVEPLADASDAWHFVELTRSA